MPTDTEIAYQFGLYTVHLLYKTVFWGDEYTSIPDFLASMRNNFVCRIWKLVVKSKSDPDTCLSQRFSISGATEIKYVE